MIKLIEPDWPAPGNVRAFCTTRGGGFSKGAYASLNLADHVGDSPASVSRNRALLADVFATVTSFQWLSQVHGTSVVQAPEAGAPEADAIWTERQGVAIAVLTADCLPVLFCNQKGTLVAAAHAGWRGLAAGVLEAIVGALSAAPQELMAWLGPAIGASAYEVGPEVRTAFLSATGSRAGLSERETAAAFQPSPVQPGHFLADLNRLARERLNAARVTQIFGGEHCTHAESDQFFSHRRDDQTGRMASLICINGA